MDGADAFSPRGSCKLLALVGGHDPFMSLYDGANRLWDRLKVSPVLIPATTAAEAARKFRTEGADLVVTDGIGELHRAAVEGRFPPGRRPSWTHCEGATPRSLWSSWSPT